MATSPPAPPRLGNSRVRLRPVEPSDYPHIYRSELSERLGPIWRHRGGTPSFESFTASLWAGVVAQYLVVRRDDPTPLGIVSLYEPDSTNGHAKLAAARFSDTIDREFVEAVAMFIEHCFSSWPLRKIYLEVPEYNLHQMAGLIGPLIIEEGRLREHLFKLGRWWDFVTLALYRDRWDESGLGARVADR